MVTWTTEKPLTRILILDFTSISKTSKFQFLQVQLPLEIKNRIKIWPRFNKYYFPTSRIIRTVLQKNGVSYAQRNDRKSLQLLVESLKPNFLIYGNYQVVSNKLKIYIYVLDVEQGNLVNRSYHIFKGNIQTVNFRARVSEMADVFVRLENFFQPKPIQAKPIQAKPIQPRAIQPKAIQPRYHYFGFRLGLPMLLGSLARESYGNLPYFGVFYQHILSNLFFLEAELGFSAYQLAKKTGKQRHYLFPITVSPALKLELVDNIFLIPGIGLGMLFSYRDSSFGENLWIPYFLIRPSLSFVTTLYQELFVGFSMIPFIYSEFSNLFDPVVILYLSSFSIYWKF